MKTFTKGIFHFHNFKIDAYIIPGTKKHLFNPRLYLENGYDENTKNNQNTTAYSGVIFAYTIIKGVGKVWSVFDPTIKQLLQLFTNCNVIFSFCQNIFLSGCSVAHTWSKIENNNKFV